MEERIYILKEYNKFIDLIDKYKFDYFIIPKKSGLFSYLKSNSKYCLIYYDKKCAIFKTK